MSIARANGRVNIVRILNIDQRPRNQKNQRLFRVLRFSLAFRVLAAVPIAVARLLATLAAALIYVDFPATALTAAAAGTPAAAVGRSSYG